MAYALAPARAFALCSLVLQLLLTLMRAAGTAAVTHAALAGPTATLPELPAEPMGLFVTSALHALRGLVEWLPPRSPALMLAAAVAAASGESVCQERGRLPPFMLYSACMVDELGAMEAECEGRSHFTGGDRAVGLASAVEDAICRALDVLAHECHATNMPASGTPTSFSARPLFFAPALASTRTLVCGAAPPLGLVGALAAWSLAELSAVDCGAQNELAWISNPTRARVLVAYGRVLIRCSRVCSHPLSPPAGSPHHMR